MEQQKATNNLILKESIEAQAKLVCAGGNRQMIDKSVWSL